MVLRECILGGKEALDIESENRGLSSYYLLKTCIFLMCISKLNLEGKSFFKNVNIRLLRLLK